jgi:hypothetical protein
MYQGTKVSRANYLCRCDLWPWPRDLNPKLQHNSLPLCISKTKWRFLVDIWWEDVSGDKGVSREWFVSMWPLDLDPVTFETEIPFRSVSPKRMKIFGWYLVGGCIRAQRCVARKICVDVTLDLDLVTLKPKLSSALLNEWRFLVDIWWEDVSGTKVCHTNDSCQCDLLTLKSKFPSGLYLYYKWERPNFCYLWSALC